MNSYEVKLKRKVTQTTYTTVSVNAETEEDAITQALKHAVGAPHEWSSNLTDPTSFGVIEVVEVEEIVSLDATE